MTSKAFLALVAAATLPFAAAPRATAQLYEGVEVLGQLRCESNADFRTQLGTDHRLRCAFTASGDKPGLIRRYFGAVIAMEPGNAAAGGNVATWTVLHLKNSHQYRSPSDAKILGGYSRASSDIAEQFSLREGSLIGGGAKNIVLEPRSTDERNAAAAVRQFTLFN
ncbi:MAG: DUF992 domain-containing protein [Alphaproteobacteria bacterium]|nr:DUF992 domain-containing protein [Alphaproteobacteria bacterium]